MSSRDIFSITSSTLDILIARVVFKKFLLHYIFHSQQQQVSFRNFFSITCCSLDSKSCRLGTHLPNSGQLDRDRLHFHHQWNRKPKHLTYKTLSTISLHYISVPRSSISTIFSKTSINHQLHISFSIPPLRFLERAFYRSSAHIESAHRSAPKASQAQDFIEAKACIYSRLKRSHSLKSARYDYLVLYQCLVRQVPSQPIWQSVSFSAQSQV